MARSADEWLASLPPHYAAQVRAKLATMTDDEARRVLAAQPVEPAVATPPRDADGARVIADLTDEPPRPRPGKGLPTLLKRPTKYGAERVPDPEVPGRTIPSKLEARRLAELRARFRGAQDPLDRMDVLATQVWFRIEGGMYVADFVYGPVVTIDGEPYLRLTVEDAKGFRTPVYQQKRRQMHERGIPVLEYTDPREPERMARQAERQAKMAAAAQRRAEREAKRRARAEAKAKKAAEQTAERKRATRALNAKRRREALRAQAKAAERAARAAKKAGGGA